METQTQAAPSPATAVAEPTFEIPRSNSPEYAKWRETGELPEKNTPKPAETAPAATSEETTDTDDLGDSAPTQTQEKPSKRRPDIEARFKQYTDRIDKLERELNEARRPKETQAESSPAPKHPQTYKEWREKFKPSEWIAQYGKDHPDASYEDANAAMADHLGDVRDQFRTIEQRTQEQIKALQSKLDDARKLYPDADKAIFPAGKAINDAAIPQAVKEMVADSDVFPHLLYVLGSDSAKFDEFIALAKSQPGKALRHIAALENGIVEELAKGSSAGSETTRNEKGQFTKTETAATPAKRGPESAPEPPIEISSRGTGTMDESDRAFQAIERGSSKATRDWLAAENAKDLRRRRGA